MRGFTGLPTSAYLKVSEEAGIPLSDLQSLVPQLESGWSPAYLARYRPDVAAGLREAQILKLLAALQAQLDLSERKITVLTAVGQRDQLTPELRERIEAVTDRRELEDLYLPHKKRLRTPADDAFDQGLEALARFLWHQESAGVDVLAEAEKYVSAERGVGSAADALSGARHIVARWLSENTQIRKDLRALFRERTIVRIRLLDKRKEGGAAHKRFTALENYQGLLNKMPWRQMLTLRRGVREERLAYEIVAPESRAVSYLLGRLVKDRRSMFCLQLGAAACLAFHEYLRAPLADEVWQDANDRSDEEAIGAFQKSLRKILMTAGAGPVPVVGLETGRSERWLAAAVDASGQFVEGAVVRGGEKTRAPGEDASQADGPHRGGNAAGENATPAPQAPQQEESTATAGSDSADSPEEQAGAEEPDATEQVTGQSAEVAEGALAQDEEGASAQTEPEEKSSEKAATEPPAASELPESPAPTAGEQQESGAAEPVAASASAEVSGKPAPAPKRASSSARAAAPSMSLRELLEKHSPQYVAIANGPGVRQAERFIRSELRHAESCHALWATVNESGSWIYANSKVAKKELPHIEPALRSAVTLARRLQDPLQEYVKLDPKILAIGQGHHEVDQRRLRAALRQTMEECVHQVGVDLNRAPAALIAMTPGLTERVARRIVDYREKHGPFRGRQQLREVPGMNDRMFEQAAGFLRVAGGENPLDRSGVHPRHYAVVGKILLDLNLTVEQAFEKPETLDAVEVSHYETAEFPAAQIRAALREFQKQAIEPRGAFEPPKPAVELRSPEDLKVGMKVEGVVTNVASFGAFVDIGADQDGLVHVSQLSDQYVEDPKSAVSIGDKVTVYILALEEGGRRISLSMREKRESARQRRAAPDARRSGALKAGDRRGPDDRRRRKPPAREGSRPGSKSFGPDEKSKARQAKEEQALSLEEKLNLLQSRFRTKV